MAPQSSVYWACSFFNILVHLSKSWRFPGEGNSCPLQYSCMENSMDRGAWWAKVHEVAKSQTWLSNNTFHLNSTSLGFILPLISIFANLYSAPFLTASWWTSLVVQMVKCLPTIQETWVQSLGWEDLLEKEMASHSSILAWKNPWTVEPGRLQSVGSQRVRHGWATSLSQIGHYRVLRRVLCAI